MTMAAARLGRLRAGGASASPAEAMAEAGTVEANQRAPRELAALGGAAEWLNSPRLTPSSLAGKVVLVDFWTYTCINWLRTLPYVRAWAQKYREGLVLIGVHTPEFAFERNVDNVRRAVKQMRIEYPVAIDNDYSIWRAFNNQYWPALYFIDARGRVRQHHFGEGEYEQSEKTIQQLLAEAGVAGISGGSVSVDAKGLEVAADWGNLKSPENYVGHERTENFVSPGGVERDRRHVYAVPARLALNQWALAGEWTIGKQATVLNSPNGRIVYRFHARDLHLVMGPVGARCLRTVPRLDRRAAAGSCSRSRRGRGRQRHRCRTAVVSANPPAEADRRSTVPDRVPRRWRGDVGLHVRLTRCAAAPAYASLEIRE